MSQDCQDFGKMLGNHFIGEAAGFFKMVDHRQEIILCASIDLKS